MRTAQPGAQKENPAATGTTWRGLYLPLALIRRDGVGGRIRMVSPSNWVASQGSCSG
jgi:hypothetical protein